MDKLRHHLAPLVTDLRVDDAGWAARSLIGSIRRTVFTMVAGWQVVMLITILLSVGASAWPLLAGHALLAGAAAFAVRRPGRLPLWIAPAAMAALGAADFLVSGDLDSVLVFAACWQIDFAGCVAGLLVLSRWVVPAVAAGAVSMCAVILQLLPGWGTQFPVAIVVTQLAIIVALRLGLPQLLALAERADAEEAAAEQATHQAEVARQVRAQIAEETRTLHDTAINTLGAIANGGAGVADVPQVRAQAARHTAVLEALRAERADAPDPAAALLAVFALPGLPIRRHGLDDEAIAGLVRRLPPAAVAGVASAAREAVTNANKHSGAPRIDVTITADGDRLRVEVRDDGVGFEGGTAQGAGLTGSVFGRGRDLGFDVDLVTAPGAGTTVTLAAGPDAPSGPPAPLASPSDDVGAVVAGIHRRAGLLWGIGVTAVSVILTLAGGTDHSFALLPMIGIMAGVWLAVRAARPGRPHWTAAVGLTAATAAVFALSAAATAFGTDGAPHWQALAATGPFTLLLSSRPSRRTVLVAATAWLLVVLGIAALTLPRSTTGAAIVIVAGCVGGTFSLIWSRFLRDAATLSAETATARRRAFHARLAVDAEHAAQDTYRHWLDAGLDSAAALLHDIAAGGRDPLDATTRHACGAEEAYLRQLMLIGPELVRLGPAIMPALRYAHDHDIPLRLRLGSQDAPDETTARSLSSIVLRALEATAPGRALAASVFPVQDGLQLTLVGDDLDGATLAGSAGARIDALSTRVQQVTFS